MSWTADDRQLIGLCDGLGWSKHPKGYYNSRLFAVAGSPQDAHIEEVSDYPYLMPLPGKDMSQYYGSGLLAVDGHIYQFLTPENWFSPSSARACRRESQPSAPADPDRRGPQHDHFGSGH
jgi:hypothetical protein